MISNCYEATGTLAHIGIEKYTYFTHSTQSQNEEILQAKVICTSHVQVFKVKSVSQEYFCLNIMIFYNKAEQERA